MEKDFDRWNKLKKTINSSDEAERVYFHEGDIWWVRLGVNVGFEIDGKHTQFARPVIVLRNTTSTRFSRFPSPRRRGSTDGALRSVTSRARRQLPFSRSCAISTACACTRRSGTWRPTSSCA